MMVLSVTVYVSVLVFFFFFFNVDEVTSCLLSPSRRLNGLVNSRQWSDVSGCRRVSDRKETRQVHSKLIISIQSYTANWKEKGYDVKAQYGPSHDFTLYMIY